MECHYVKLKFGVQCVISATRIIVPFSFLRPYIHTKN